MMRRNKLRNMEIRMKKMKMMRRKKTLNRLPLSNNKTPITINRRRDQLRTKETKPCNRSNSNFMATNRRIFDKKRILNIFKTLKNQSRMQTAKTKIEATIKM